MHHVRICVDPARRLISFLRVFMWNCAQCANNLESGVGLLTSFWDPSHMWQPHPEHEQAVEVNKGAPRAAYPETSLIEALQPQCRMHFGGQSCWTLFPHTVQKCMKIRGLGCVTRALVRA